MLPHFSCSWRLLSLHCCRADNLCFNPWKRICSETIWWKSELIHLSETHTKNPLFSENLQTNSDYIFCIRLPRSATKLSTHFFSNHCVVGNWDRFSAWGLWKQCSYRSSLKFVTPFVIWSQGKAVSTSEENGSFATPSKWFCFLEFIPHQILEWLCSLWMIQNKLPVSSV